jgi:mannose-6-phosphate isomerase
MYRLENALRPYAWGSLTAIAELFGREPSGSPEAELWIGAHPGAPSQVQLPDGSTAPLDEFIARDPEAALGAQTVADFGPQLPFLAKVLAAGGPLSLQVHPTREQASAGFAAENAAGVPLDAPFRNYRDANHKPEMLLALSPFEALCGFRDPQGAAGLFRQVADALQAVGKSAPLLEKLIGVLEGPEPESARLKTAFTALIDGGADVRALVTEAAEALETAFAGVPAEAASGRELRTVIELNAAYPGDPGVLISLMLNRASLQPGEAIYLPAGNVHAYLSGLGVEVMASSDNVLRGGLTPKHVDVPELLKTIEFKALGLPKVEPELTGLDQQVYRPPFREFQLQRIELAPGSEPVPLVQQGPAVVLATAGSARLDSPHNDLILGRGQSAFIPAAESPVMVHPTEDGKGTAVLFAATVAGTWGGSQPEGADRRA